MFGGGARCLANKIYATIVLLLFILLVVFVCLHFFSDSKNDKVVTAVAVGDYFSYTYSGATLTYQITEYSSSSSSLRKVSVTGWSSGSSINIPGSVSYGGLTYTVTAVGPGAFSENTTITSVNIPNTVTSIGGWAFSVCSNLKGTFTIPNSVVNIDTAAFYHCSGITGINLGSSVTVIGESAFTGCTGLSSLTFPETLMSIGDWSFAECVGLRGVLVIPNRVESIGESAFNGCVGLVGVTLGNNVKTIGPWAFGNCSGLQGNLIIPDNVITIGEAAFNGCSGLEGVTFGKNLESLGGWVFSGCVNLSGALVMPDGVKSICESAFNGCTKLTSLYLGKNIESIGGWAFSGCTGLTGDLIIPDTVTSIGDAAFNSCSGLTGLMLSASITSIGGWTFASCTGLDGSLIIPDRVTSVGDAAFFGCSNLTTINIGSGVNNIAANSFAACTGVKDVYFYNDLSNTVLSEGAFTYGNEEVNYWFENTASRDVAASSTNVFTAVDNFYVAGVLVVVTFLYNGATGGHGVGSKQVTSAKEYGELPVPEKIGYVFCGWKLGNLGGADIVSTTIVITSVNHNLYAVWTANTYKVFYHANGGEGEEMAFSEHTYDIYQNLGMNTYARYTYRFVGWHTDSEAKTALYLDGENVKNLTSSIDGVVDLYAIWEYVHAIYNRVAVSATYGGIAEIVGDNYQELGNEGKIKVKAVVCIAGYSFVGWYCIEANEASLISESSEAEFLKEEVYECQLEARFEDDEGVVFGGFLSKGEEDLAGVVVTAQYGGEIRIVGDNYSALNDGDKITLIANIVQENYAFLGWYIIGEEDIFLSDEMSVMLDKSVVNNNLVEARFQYEKDKDIKMETNN